MRNLPQCTRIFIEENEEDVFGIRAAATDMQNGVLDRKGYISAADRLCKRFGFKAVTITLCKNICRRQLLDRQNLHRKGLLSRRNPIHIVTGDRRRKRGDLRPILIYAGEVSGGVKNICGKQGGIVSMRCRPYFAAGCLQFLRRVLTLQPAAVIMGNVANMNVTEGLIYACASASPDGIVPKAKGLKLFHMINGEGADESSLWRYSRK